MLSFRLVSILVSSVLTVSISVCTCVLDCVYLGFYLYQLFVSVLLCVDTSFNLPSQPEAGVATLPKKPWPPIGGDRRVSVSANQDSPHLFMG